MSKSTSEFLQMSKEEANKNFFQLTHDYTIENSYTKVYALHQLDDHAAVCSVPFIFCKDHGASFQWSFGNVKLLDEDTMISFCLPLPSFGKIVQKMENVLEEHRFFRRHFEKFSNLTKREKELLKLIASGYSNKLITELWCVSPDTVRTHRNRLYRKLEIKRVADTIKYVEAFDIIK